MVHGGHLVPVHHRAISFPCGQPLFGIFTHQARASAIPLPCTSRYCTCVFVRSVDTNTSMFTLTNIYTSMALRILTSVLMLSLQP